MKVLLLLPQTHVIFFLHYSNFMRQQAMSSKMLFNRAVPVNRLVTAIADSASYSLFPYPNTNIDGVNQSHFNLLEAQVNTQEYGRRPYGVGFLVIGHDESGPHLYEFSPSGNSYEYFAMSIGARSQSAKTYLEKHYEEFAEGKATCVVCLPPFFFFLTVPLITSFPPPPVTPASLEDLVRHGLHALRETLQQDKELNVNNTSIGLIGPTSEHEKKSVHPQGAFRILENEAVEPFLLTMVAKGSETAAAAPAAAASSSGGAAAGTGDVQMAD